MDTSRDMLVAKSPVTCVDEQLNSLDASRDMFEDSMTTTTVPETPEPPNPPPMPVQRVQEYVQTLPITPVRLQGQRWRNWGLSRLSHLPSVRYSDSEVIANLEDQRWQDSEIMQELPEDGAQNEVHEEH